MSDKEKLLQLIRRLQKATATGKLRWEKTARKDDFLASHGGLAINIYEGSQDDTIFLALLNSDGDLLQTISKHDFDTMVASSEADSLLNNMYQKARWQALGVEKVVDSLLSAFPDEDDEIPSFK
jgi:hypothetical protein